MRPNERIADLQEEAQDEEDTPLLRADETRYSIFTKHEKQWVVFLVAYAGLFSPLSSFVQSRQGLEHHADDG